MVELERGMRDEDCECLSISEGTRATGRSKSWLSWRSGTLKSNRSRQGARTQATHVEMGAYVPPAQNTNKTPDGISPLIVPVRI